MFPILPTAQTHFNKAGHQQIKGLSRRKRVQLSAHELSFTNFFLDQYYSLSSLRFNVMTLTSANRISVSGHIQHDILTLIKINLEWFKGHSYSDLRNAMFSVLVTKMSDFISKYSLR